MNSSKAECRREAASGGSRGGGCAGEYCRRRFTSRAQNAKHWACLKRGNDEILSLRVRRREEGGGGRREKARDK